METADSFSQGEELMKRRLDVSAEVKRTAVSRVSAGEAVSAVAADLGVDRRRVYEWQEIARRGGLEALRGPGRPRRSQLDGPPLRSALLNDGLAARQRIAELERKIGEQQGDLDFSSLAACEGKTAGGRGVWQAAVWEVIRAMTVSQGSQTIQRLCRLAGVSRAGYYRFWQKSAPREHDTAGCVAHRPAGPAPARAPGGPHTSHQ